jgi:hypothetical protein
MMQRFPEMTGEPVRDKDQRVVRWSIASRDRKEKTRPS